MYILLYSGLLYLLGISIILIIRPAIMFATDGAWKEFGIGRNRSRYTWIPFWLFAIMWAIISYIIVFTMLTNYSTSIYNTMPSTNTGMIQVQTTPIPDTRRRKGTELKPGYYILNQEGTIKKGVPKYVYLGKESPNLIYNYSETPENIFEENMSNSDRNM